MRSAPSTYQTLQQQRSRRGPLTRVHFAPKAANPIFSILKLYLSLLKLHDSWPERSEPVRLTIDDIVSKYATLNRDEEFVRSLGRRGLSATVIAKPPKSTWRGDDAKRAKQVERFRQNLVAMSRVDQIKEYLSLFGARERIHQLWQLIPAEPTDVFWPVVLDNWQISDPSRALQRVILEAFRQRATECRAIKFMSVANREFFDRLANPVPVFRGCSKRNIRGMAWTTDKRVAEFCARSFSTPCNPVIASAVIEKAHVFFVLTDREESKVILDPYRVKRLRLEPVASSKEVSPKH